MQLIHCFPRPRFFGEPPNDAIAERTLRSILQFGLLCTPERLDIPPDLRTASDEKLKAYSRDRLQFSYLQSRMCFTLCEPEELFEKKIKGLEPGENGPVRSTGKALAHCELFGPYAVAFDPIVARRLGIVPTIYFSRSDVFGARLSTGTPGLNLQTLQRLTEIRELLILLAELERSLVVSGAQLPTEEMLRKLDLTIPFENAALTKIRKMTAAEREPIVQLFNTDRNNSLSLAEFVGMLLNLYQEADSKTGDEILAFFQQREWRLIHHTRLGMIWYSLGDMPEIRNPQAGKRQKRIQLLREFLNWSRQRDEKYFDYCWVLEEVDEKPVREYINCIVVPQRFVEKAKYILNLAKVKCDVMIAEDLGYSGLLFSNQGRTEQYPDI